MSFAIPSSIETEHHELHRALEGVISAGGATGKAAHHLSALLAPHFEKEEAYAMPPLGLLVPLAHDQTPTCAEAILGLAERLRSELPAMLDEHQQIRTALAELAAAARSENRPDAERFAERLSQHAMHEEEILYPAALLVGRYLELKRTSWE